MQYENLKYWGVVRHYFQTRYGLSLNNLDLLLYIYSIKYIKKKDLYEYAYLSGYSRYRVNDLLNKGWIIPFNFSINHKPTTYMMSLKGRSAIKSMYDMLDGSVVTINPSLNPMFKVNVSNTKAKYAKFIIKLNEERKRLLQIPIEKRQSLDNNDIFF